MGKTSGGGAPSAGGAAGTSGSATAGAAARANAENKAKEAAEKARKAAAEKAAKEAAERARKAAEAAAKRAREAAAKAAREQAAAAAKEKAAAETATPSGTPSTALGAAVEQSAPQLATPQAPQAPQAAPVTLANVFTQGDLVKQRLDQLKANRSQGEGRTGEEIRLEQALSFPFFEGLDKPASQTRLFEQATGGGLTQAQTAQIERDQVTAGQGAPRANVPGVAIPAETPQQSPLEQAIQRGTAAAPPARGDGSAQTSQEPTFNRFGPELSDAVDQVAESDAGRQQFEQNANMIANRQQIEQFFQDNPQATVQDAINSLGQNLESQRVGRVGRGLLPGETDLGSDTLFGTGQFRTVDTTPPPLTLRQMREARIAERPGIRTTERGAGVKITQTTDQGLRLSPIITARTPP